MASDKLPAEALGADQARELIAREGDQTPDIMDAWSGEKLPLQPAEDYEYEGPRHPGPLGQ